MLVFSNAGGALKWTYRFKYDVVLWGDAEGTVISFTPPTIQLAGTWTKHAVPLGGHRVEIHPQCRRRPDEGHQEPNRESISASVRPPG